MSNDKEIARLWKLQATVSKLVLDGKRDPTKVADTLQTIVDEPSPDQTTPKQSTEWIVDHEGNIQFTLISNGFSPQRWQEHLARRGSRIGDLARQVLRHASEAPTNGVAYSIVVRPGKKINPTDRITKRICAAAEKCGWLKPHWEVACLIRDKFTEEQLDAMGLWSIVTMHEPICDSLGDQRLLDSRRDGDGCWLEVRYAGPDHYWSSGYGFAFEIPASAREASK